MKTALCCLLVLTTGWLNASKRDSEAANLAKYLARVQMAQPAAPALSPGSIWVDWGRMASLSADYKAMMAGDVITILVVQDVTSSNAGAVSTARTFSASSGVDSLPGKLKVGGAANLLGLHSAETLSGKGQASSTASVTTTLAGRVVAVLGSGNLVVEAERVINMNHEKQTIVLRGVVRRGDIGPDNTVASNTISDLELEIKGKGVISDGVRPPHPLLRAILRILNF
ncbi:MAG: flagellar basal body L-ring protein FlgH [Acidobacteriia bacterium]|jgi:flagellar L-ring protein FlgH|nr:flagellar basal body L-ring protein FlgH [Terriglobia bacterium]